MSVNSSINKQLEKIFDVFNNEFFDSELEIPLFRFESNCNKDGFFNSNAVINQGRTYSHEIIIPVKILNNDIEDIAECLLHNMIHYYAFIKGFNVCSRQGQYHNKRFKTIADFCGLTCKYNGLTGWVDYRNKEFDNLCKLYEFKKTWKNRYTKNEDILGKKSINGNNSRKYVCPCCGTIIRATRPVEVICKACKKQFVQVYK